MWQSKVNIPDAGCLVPQLFKDIGSFQAFALSSLEELSSAWSKLVRATSKCTLGRKGPSMEGGWATRLCSGATGLDHDT